MPFSGAPGLFALRPSTACADPPSGLVRGSELLISHSGIATDPLVVKGELDRLESAVKDWVSRINAEVDAFNICLPAEVQARLTARLERTHADGVLVGALGVPIHQRPAVLRDDLGRGRRQGAATTGGASTSAPRHAPGRAGWTPELFEEHWREAVAKTRQPHTYRALAENFWSRDGVQGRQRKSARQAASEIPGESISSGFRPGFRPSFRPPCSW